LSPIGRSYRIRHRPDEAAGGLGLHRQAPDAILEVVRLFRKSEERIAQEPAAEAEIDRLRKLSVEELAVILLPRLGPEQTPPGHNLRPQQLCEYLLRDFPDIGQTMPLQLMAPVRRALDRLEAVGLVSSMSVLQRSPMWQITSLGASVLADGTVQQRLVGSA
jgi:hypothetical protein